MLNDEKFAEVFLNTYNFTNFNYLRLHRNTATNINNLLRPTSVLDFGCGIGATFVEFLALGVDAYGYDTNTFLRDYFCKWYPMYKDKFLTSFEQLRPSYDLLFTCEVFEHLTDEQIAKLFNSVKFNKIVLSSTPTKTTPEADAEWGHINVKSIPEWVEFISKYGYYFQVQTNLPTVWTLIFENKEK